MFRTMNHTAAALAPPAMSGANVGPRVVMRCPSSPGRPMTPSQTTGLATKYRVATIAARYIAFGTFRNGFTVSPTWQAAASNAGAAKPMR